MELLKTWGLTPRPPFGGREISKRLDVVIKEEKKKVGGRTEHLFELAVVVHSAPLSSRSRLKPLFFSPFLLSPLNKKKKHIWRLFTTPWLSIKDIPNLRVLISVFIGRILTLYCPLFAFVIVNRLPKWTAISERSLRTAFIIFFFFFLTQIYFHSGFSKRLSNEFHYNDGERRTVTTSGIQR